MGEFSIGDDIHAKVEKRSNGYIAVVQESELLIRNGSDLTAGDTVTVRVVGPSSVIIPNESDYGKEGLPGELFAIVDHCPNHYPSKVRCIEPPFVGEQFLIDDLVSESNKIIPIIPLDAAAENRAAVCTKPSLWPGERVGERSEYSYSSKILDCFNNSETVTSSRVEKLKGLIAKTRTVKKAELRITETDFIAPKALEHTSDDSYPDSETEENNQSSDGKQSSSQTSIDENYNKSKQTQIDSNKEPQLSNDEVSYTTTRRRQRDPDFTQMVKSAYEEKCAICGKRRVTPDGNPEVEAAHIYPKSEGGIDHVQNGLALCKFHHWAFDRGWMSIREDYTIIIADHQELDGYDELKEFESNYLHLPVEDNNKPHVKFIREHQRIHDFNP